MSRSQRHTVRVRADHSVVLQNPSWVPGQTVEIVVIENTPSVPYSALQVLESCELDTPEDFSSLRH